MKFRKQKFQDIFQKITGPKRALNVFLKGSLINCIQITFAQLGSIVRFWNLWALRKKCKTHVWLTLREFSDLTNSKFLLQHGPVQWNEWSEQNSLESKEGFSKSLEIKVYLHQSGMIYDTGIQHVNVLFCIGF